MFLFLALTACTPKETGDTGTPSDTADDTADSSGDTSSDTSADTSGDTSADSGDTASDTSADSGDDTGALLDVRDEMDPSATGCEELGGSAVAGAARYFWGEYEGDAEAGWTGTEAVYVYANPTWVAAGGADCVGLWTVTGVAAGTGACPTCEVGMRVVATYDVVNSTCPIEFYGEDFAEDYALDEDAAGTVRWFYARSGNVMGDGYWVAGGGRNFLSTRGCVWF